MSLAPSGAGKSFAESGIHITNLSIRGQVGRLTNGVSGNLQRRIPGAADGYGLWIEGWEDGSIYGTVHPLSLFLRVVTLRELNCRLLSSGRPPITLPADAPPSATQQGPTPSPTPAAPASSAWRSTSTGSSLAGSTSMGSTSTVSTATSSTLSAGADNLGHETWYVVLKGVVPGVYPSM